VEAIHQIDPDVQFFGMGGDALSRVGMHLLCHHRSLSVVGLAEVISKLGSIWKALKELKQALVRETPDLVILIDFPDFNLRLAKRSHQLGIPVLYYISPQVWAWRPGRVKLIRRWVKKMVVFFPFEVPIYEAAGVDVVWVGHPLLDSAQPTLSKDKARQQFGLDPVRPTIALLPGSRESELKRILPPLLAAAHLLHQEIPDLQFVIPLAPGLTRRTFARWSQKAVISFNVVQGWVYDVMNLSDLLITASGTATLEGALLGKPMVIVYKVSPFSYWIGRALVRIDHIGMVNLVAGKRIVPELLQREATPGRIAAEALRILKDPALQHRMVESMGEMRQRLGDPGAAQRAAHIVCSLLESNEASIKPSPAERVPS
jgi:lipid-A-disaccharide synthase